MRSSNSRQYRMKKRAEQVDETRLRIVEAAVHLHGTIGPSGTTIAGIAEQAGVTRLTVYRHFPDDDAIYAACSAHWQSQHAGPDPVAWAEIADPTQRLRAGLTDLYRFYRHGESMLSKIYRDREYLPESMRNGMREQERVQREILSESLPARRTRALVGHAASFGTWRSLCLEQGLSDTEAVDAMVALVTAA